jgi:hypothetical protein
MKAPLPYLFLLLYSTTSAITPPVYKMLHELEAVLHTNARIILFCAFTLHPYIKEVHYANTVTYIVSH